MTNKLDAISRYTKVRATASINNAKTEELSKKTVKSTDDVFEKIKQNEKPITETITENKKKTKIKKSFIQSFKDMFKNP